jgi:hypothetical protein
VREGERKPKLKVDNALALSESREKLAKSVHVRLKTRGLEECFVKELFETCAKNKGDCSLIIHVSSEEHNEYKVRAGNMRIKPDKDAMDILRDKVGKENVWLSKSAA